MLVGDRGYSVGSDFASSSATFAGIQGTSSGNGIFASTYTLAPGLNEIQIKGNGTITDKRSHNSCTTGCKEPSIDAITLNEGFAIMKVYGVDIDVDSPPVIIVDSDGLAMDYYDLFYTIKPAEYQASSAYMFIYKEGDSVPLWFMANAQQGSGKATIDKGFQFDINSKYEAEIVLNYGTGVEIRSARVPLRIVNFKIVKPTIDEKILIKNDADGTPKMQPLTAEALLRGTGIDPSMINNQQICWNFRVEYYVNITKPGAEYRSRWGLEPIGAGQGKDGYLIPPPGTDYPDGCKPWTGATFVIDDTGTNGIQWGSNFGGGTLTITAKTNIDGVDISDTYIGKIEGETTTTAFRGQMITYLKQAATTGTPSLQSILGSGDVLFALACVETYGINHFWPSLFGSPVGAIYPIENSTGDGGFGVMQLTDPIPTYREIWHWKENIDAGTDIVRNKINDSSNGAAGFPQRQQTKRPDFKLDSFTPAQLRMDVYSLFRGGHYWMATKNGWKVSNHNPAGVEEATKASKNEGRNTCQ